MIEGSKIDDGGHGNEIDVVTSEMIDFDQTIGKVLEFAKQDKKAEAFMGIYHNNTIFNKLKQAFNF